MAQQMPSVGRMVHYVSHGTPPREDGTQAYPSKCRAAVVTEVSEKAGEEDVVGLCVTNPTGLFFHPLAEDAHGTVGVHHDERHGGGTWHWPERV